MKHPKRAAMLAFIALFQTSCDFSYPPRTEEFDSYADAVKADKAFETWIPHFVPRDSTNLRMGMIPDRNEQWMMFSFPKTERETLLLRLNSVNGPEVELPRADPTLHISWWPDGLSKQSENLSPYNLFCGFIEVDPPSGEPICGGFLAVEHDAPRAYFWHLGQ